MLLLPILLCVFALMPNVVWVLFVDKIAFSLEGTVLFEFIAMTLNRALNYDNVINYSPFNAYSSVRASM